MGNASVGDGHGLKGKVISGAFWIFMDKIGVQAIELVVGLVLARLLCPSDFGTVALTGVFFAIAHVLVDAGFGLALVQKKDADNLDFNTIFYASIALSLMMYGLIFLAAPLIAEFYSTPELVAIVRVSAVCFVFNAVNSVQAAEFSRRMMFDVSYKISMLMCGTTAITGIALAFGGFGVWALVWAKVATGLVGVIARWTIIAWRPRLMFSVDRLRGLFSYGWKMAAANLIDQCFVQIDGLLIGRFYAKADLAFVDKGKGLAARIMDVVNSVMGDVSFLAFVRMQDDQERLLEAARHLIRNMAFIVYPCMVLLAVSARSVIRALFGDQWGSAVPFMRVFCLAYLCVPMMTVNIRGLMAIGQSDVILRVGVVSKVVQVLALVGSIRFGVYWFIVCNVVVIYPFVMILYSVAARRFLGYALQRQLLDMLPCLCASVVAGAGAYAGAFLSARWIDADTSLGAFLSAGMQWGIGLFAYLAVAGLLKMHELREYIEIGRSFWRRFRR